MVKIYLDPGHGGTDPGAVGNGLQEKHVTLQIALIIREYLNAYRNVSIKMSRTSDKTVSLKKRTDDANKWGADLYVSIHINAGRGTGFESYIYSGLANSSKAGKFRSILHDKIKRVIQMKDRGKKRANFHVLRETKMPAVLTENGFIDTKSDAQKMKNKNWIDQVGKAHAEGIAEIFQLKKKSSKKVSNPNASKGNKNNEKFTLTTDVRGYYTAEDARLNRNRRTTVRKGTYYVFKRHNGMINVSKRIGSPGSWINPALTSFRIGNKVSIKNTAIRYATGQTIPNWVKSKKYTIQQVKSDRVLLREIYSWVKITDISK